MIIKLDSKFFSKFSICVKCGKSYETGDTRDWVYPNLCFSCEEKMLRQNVRDGR